ncbi:protein gp37 [Amycolatopsis sulphurea]|uniref:Protein gp37 n=1 Tax=Amycolatopsis sulphurea TaxID=76022 RepID=A0A2A9FCF7_9PSEU|nr:phage Gp37/Gp68 family protein [Amycolatopsis sulphurea]PFG48466.1 protein gp37 [Amycolatopsis sulphurea]
MAASSKIEWTEVTWNPVTGCDRISTGCDNCYALTLAKRLKAMGATKYQNDGNPVTSGPGFDVSVHPETLNQPYRWRAPKKVFVNSMSDLFHARVPSEFISDVFRVMADTPQHRYQLLTKRPKRAVRIANKFDWLENIWMGVSVENEDHIGRIDELRKIPAAVRFLSCEPLVGPLPNLDLNGIDWVIVGGESGSQSRNMPIDWVRDIRDQCYQSETAFFFKQWGGRTPKANGRSLDGRTWDEFPDRESAPLTTET